MMMVMNDGDSDVDGYDDGDGDDDDGGDGYGDGDADGYTTTVATCYFHAMCHTILHAQSPRTILHARPASDGTDSVVVLAAPAYIINNVENLLVLI